MMKQSIRNSTPFIIINNDTVNAINALKYIFLIIIFSCQPVNTQTVEIIDK